MNLAGYVRNLSGGAVQVRVEGERKQLSQLVKRLGEGPPGARVEKVVTHWSEYTGNYSDFRIRH